MSIHINQSGPVPIYVQLAEQCRARIESGIWPPGMRLPSEPALAREHGISRGTVRQAMQLLANAGLVERRQGKGTFVAVPAAQPANRLLGALLPYKHDLLTLDILAGVEQAARAHGYHVIFSPAGEQRIDPIEVAQMRAKGVGGLVIFPPSNTAHDEAIARLQAEGVPLVLVDRYLPGLATDYVVADNLDGGYQATRHLIACGHARIGFLTPSGLQTTSVRDRFMGYRRALAEADLPYDEALFLWYREGLMQPDPELAALCDYLAAPQRPTAIFAVTDLLAIRVLDAAQRVGLRVPLDLALVGYDDIRAAQLGVPLTTVAQPRTAIGQRAGEILLERLYGLRTEPAHVVLPVRLVVRQSCGANARAHPEAGIAR
ncbi:MAG: GntR family transcriptional regulator [Anaerolineae bacterium]|nr:GntR family transcriptional regulator [Anaerolineae bacterium]